MSDWLYPMAETSRYVLWPHGYQQPVSFAAFVAEHALLVRSGQTVTDWHVAQNGDDAEEGDTVWAYSCQVNGDQGVCGKAEVAWIDAPNERIGLDWDLDVTALLIASPFPGWELRTQVPGFEALSRRKRALTRLSEHPEIVVLLEHHAAVLVAYGGRGWSAA